MLELHCISLSCLCFLFASAVAAAAAFVLVAVVFQHAARVVLVLSSESFLQLLHVP